MAFFFVPSRLDLFFAASTFSSSISTAHPQHRGFLFPPYYSGRHGIEVAVETSRALIGRGSCSVQG